MAVAPQYPKLPDESLASKAGSRPSRFHSDYGIAVGIVAFCAVVYGITLTFPELPPALSSGMSPAVFPRLLLGLLVLLAALLAFSAKGKPDEVREPIPAIVYWTALAMVAFMAVVWFAGMPVAMVAGFIGIGLLWGE